MADENTFVLSPLGHTWIFDLDGTLVKHNGYKLNGHDTLLPGVKDFFARIPENDYILILTSRSEEYKELSESYLKEQGIRYDKIIYGLPYGERLLVNDDKPSGLKMAYAIDLVRDEFIDVAFSIDPNR